MLAGFTQKKDLQEMHSISKATKTLRCSTMTFTRKPSLGGVAKRCLPPSAPKGLTVILASGQVRLARFRTAITSITTKAKLHALPSSRTTKKLNQRRLSLISPTARAIREPSLPEVQVKRLDTFWVAMTPKSCARQSLQLLFQQM